MSVHYVCSPAFRPSGKLYFVSPAHYRRRRVVGNESGPRTSGNTSTGGVIMKGRKKRKMSEAQIASGFSKLA